MPNRRSAHGCLGPVPRTILRGAPTLCALQQQLDRPTAPRTRQGGVCEMRAWSGFEFSCEAVRAEGPAAVLYAAVVPVVESSQGRFTK